MHYFYLEEIFRKKVTLQYLLCSIIIWGLRASQHEIIGARNEMICDDYEGQWYPEMDGA